MKRSRVPTGPTRIEAARIADRARARVSPGSLAALLTLLDDADTTMGQLLAGSAAVASLTADMVTRKDDSLKQACGDVRAARVALVHSTKRVAYCARRRARLTTKRNDATTELLTITAKQLRVWGSPALVQESVMGRVAAGCALAALRPPPAVNASVWSDLLQRVLDVCTSASAVSGVGLCVVSAAGPGVEWIEPHSRNEFSVVLSHADGSVPVWLKPADFNVSVLSFLGSAFSCSAVPAVTATVTATERGVVSVAYWGLHDTVLEVVIQMTVCGVSVVDCTAASDTEDTKDAWAVRALRKRLGGLECAAFGVLVYAVYTQWPATSPKSGLAVSADEKWLVVGLQNEDSLSVYALPGGELVRSFGAAGDGPLQFDGLARLTFAPNGNIIAVDQGNLRLQEVTLEGVFVRFIGVGAFNDNDPFCVDVHGDTIAVGCLWGAGPRVTLFDFSTGAVKSSFGEVGPAPGQLSECCPGIRFTPDGGHVVIAEEEAQRVSVVTTSGVFVSCATFGAPDGGEHVVDVVLSMFGEFVVVDSTDNQVCVFSPDGSELVRRWGKPSGRVVCNGQFLLPIALTAVGQHLYVLDRWTVNVFK